MSNMDSADLSSGEQSPPDETDTAPLEPPQSVSTDMHLILERKLLLFRMTEIKTK